MNVLQIYLLAPISRGEISNKNCIINYFLECGFEGEFFSYEFEEVHNGGQAMVQNSSVAAALLVVAIEAAMLF